MERRVPSVAEVQDAGIVLREGMGCQGAASRPGHWLAGSGETATWLQEAAQEATPDEAFARQPRRCVACGLAQEGGQSRVAGGIRLI